MKEVIAKLQEVSENLAVQLALIRAWKLRGTKSYRDKLIAEQRKIIVAAEREIRKAEKNFRLAPKRIAQATQRVKQLRAEATEVRCGRQIAELVRLAREIAKVKET